MKLLTHDKEKDVIEVRIHFNNAVIKNEMGQMTVLEAMKAYSNFYDSEECEIEIMLKPK